MFHHYMDSQPGNRRSINEDVVGCDTQRNVWLVADGMGGHAAGEVASAIARSTFLAEFASSGSLNFSARAAHRSIVEAAAQDSAHAGMGSTLVALHLQDNRADVAWVGDSRAYLWRQGSLRRLSKDHSALQDMIDAGTLTPEQAFDHPDGNIVTQILGWGNPEPSRRSLDIESGDWYLLCSDGLTDELTDEQIAQILKSSESIKPAVDELITKACERRGKDNISVVLVEAAGEGAKTRSAPHTVDTLEMATLAGSVADWVKWAALGLLTIGALVLAGWLLF